MMILKDLKDRLDLIVLKAKIKESYVNLRTDKKYLNYEPVGQKLDIISDPYGEENWNE